MSSILCCKKVGLHGKSTNKIKENKYSIDVYLKTTTIYRKRHTLRRTRKLQFTIGSITNSVGKTAIYQ